MINLREYVNIIPIRKVILYNPSETSGVDGDSHESPSQTKTKRKNPTPFIFKGSITLFENSECIPFHIYHKSIFTMITFIYGRWTLLLTHDF